MSKSSSLNSNIHWFVGAFLLFALTSCNGILNGIYDEPADATESDYGFTSRPAGSTPGVIYVDATSYTDWVYLDFHNMQTSTRNVNDPEPDNWDIALHRYDAKTNGGEVAVTGATGFSSFSGLYAVEEDDYHKDEWTEKTIVTDMSTMMDGYLSYVPSFYNSTLSQWLDVDKSNMPPTYTLSNKVYIIRLADGTKAAVKLGNYMDAASVKGYLTIQYIYPFQ